MVAEHRHHNQSLFKYYSSDSLGHRDLSRNAADYSRVISVACLISPSRYLPARSSMLIVFDASIPIIVIPVPAC